MIELKTNAEGQLTEEGKEQVEIMMSEVAQKCLVALATLTAEDLRSFNNGVETANVGKVKVLLEDIVVEEDIPVIFTSSIGGQLKLVETLIKNISNAFINAQTIIAIDAMGKKYETEVSTKDVRDGYDNVVAKRMAEKPVVETETEETPAPETPVEEAPVAEEPNKQ